MLATALVSGVAASTATAAPPVASAVQIGDFGRPAYVTATPAHPDLLFVVEQPGRVSVLDDEVPEAEPFLDIRSLVKAKPDPGAENEQGMFSIAFPPDYADSGLFYVYFNNNDGDIEIDEFQVSATDPTIADRDSRRPVIVIEHRAATNHSGGQMHFGPNGPLLYFATGDGGAGQRANARDLEVLLGKVIRIDPREHGANPYRVPASNPYVGVPGRDEIYAYGLRNPWRWSFDGSRVLIGDVGQSNWEEVNALRLRDLRGVNFGWPEYEGNELFEPTLPGQDPPTFPVHTYGHAETGGCAIIGGYVVRDPSLVGLFGRYLYSDYCTGEIRSLRISFAGPEPEVLNDAPAGITLSQINGFGEGIGGQLYFSRRSGEVYRLEAPAP